MCASGAARGVWGASQKTRVLVSSKRWPVGADGTLITTEGCSKRNLAAWIPSKSSEIMVRLPASWSAAPCAKKAPADGSFYQCTMLQQIVVALFARRRLPSPPGIPPTHIRWRWRVSGKSRSRRPRALQVRTCCQCSLQLGCLAPPPSPPPRTPSIRRFKNNYIIRMDRTVVGNRTRK